MSDSKSASMHLVMNLAQQKEIVTLEEADENPDLEAGRVQVLEARGSLKRFPFSMLKKSSGSLLRKTSKAARKVAQHL